MDDPLEAAGPKPCCVCAAPGGKHCIKCKSRHYCSKACQLVNWKERGHKGQCQQMAAEFQDRLLDALMPAKKVKEDPPIVDDVAPAAGSKAAARLSAVPTTALVKASALNDDTPAWRGKCAICMDLLPVEVGGQAFYSCCCKRMCKECLVKCVQYDQRCPLCRAQAPKSIAEDLRRLKKHADEGNADAQLELAHAYRDGQGLEKSLKRAFELYKLASAQGHAIAQAQMGACYENGEGGKIDFKTAALWYRRAAKQEFTLGQTNLGQMLYTGRGVAQSYDEAEKWFRLAAAQGQADALYSLGVCYANGHGVPQDLEEALRLWKRAAAKGCARAPTAAEKLEALRQA